MEDSSSQSSLHDEILAFREELEDLRELLDPDTRIRKAGTFVEKVVLSHFIPSDTEDTRLAELLRIRKSFLKQHGLRLSNVDFARRVRNAVTHEQEFKPTEKQMDKASDVLLRAAEFHIEELERRAGPHLVSPIASATDQSTPIGLGSETLEELKPKTYATQIDREPRPLLEAADDDPELSASTVAEYTFCPRAGILTHEGGFSDPEEELPSLALLPWYEREAIEEAYTHALYVLYAMPVGLVAAFVIVSLLMRGHSLYAIVVIALVIGWFFLAKKAYRRWRDIGERRLAAQLATECNPVPGKNAFQPVDWWGLLLAGYEVRRPETALHDERWKLRGKPRRILEKGALSIPVHRIRKPEGPILPQHIVRVMAHCHLIERTEGADSPFAVILFGNTYQGMTVPNTTENRERFYHALERARTAIIESDAGDRQPPEPVTGNACSSCHFGHPRPVALEDKTMRYGEPLDPVLFHNGKKVFHCDCGDRFHWKPKHERTRKLRKLE